jgi:hypothetical protein
MITERVAADERNRVSFSSGVAVWVAAMSVSSADVGRRRDESD